MNKIIKAKGYTIRELIEKLTGLVKAGLGDLPVMIDASSPGQLHKKVARAGKGMIGILSDGTKALIIEQGKLTDIPIITPDPNIKLTGEKNGG